ncbi:cold-shock protein [Candidatus Marinamargulisbacteria bacterium SCGC AAA071-K20]|nr:cold-shock protein [Candidatus Marinamargulisbacteria bacterium SCGC AAA071-K20]
MSTSGKVKWFNETKGFGFIEVEGAKDVFIHVNQIKTPNCNSLNDGQEVEFDIEDGEKGPQATNLLIK